jgi:hypothetical protein
MSTNVYRSHQVIEFGDEPNTYYGWYITTSGSDESVTHFDTFEKREAFLAAVQRAFPEADEWHCERYAAMQLIRYLNSEGLGDDLLADEVLTGTSDDEPDWDRVITSIQNEEESAIEDEPEEAI